MLSLVLAEPPLHRWACRTSEGRRLYRAFMHDVWRPAAEAFAARRELCAMRLLIDGMAGRAVFRSLPAQHASVALRNATAMRLHTQSGEPFPHFPRRSVARLGLSTLLVQGADSSALHRCVVDELARVLAGAERVSILEAGHRSPTERPDAFNAAVLGFLDRQ